MAQPTTATAQLARKGAKTPEEEKGLKAAAKKKSAEAYKPSQYATFRPLREAEFNDQEWTARLVVIDEGLGNMRDMRYYGPEAMESVGVLISGSKCYMNHQTLNQRMERPEGDLWSLVGYWRDGVVETGPNGKKRVVATLVCDKSETGEAGYQKLKHAVKYAKDFPNLVAVYCGTSINGDGDLEERELTIDGQTLKVNYVKAVTALPSADLVTQPARGGRVLQMLESISGCATWKEAEEMAKKGIAGIFQTIREALSGKDPRKVESAVEEAEKAAAALLSEADEKKGKEEEAADEACRGSEDEAKGKGKGEAEDEAEDGEGDGNGDTGHEEPDGDEAPAGAKGKITKTIKHEEKHVMTPSESAKVIRKLEKQLAEARAANAAVEKERVGKLLAESGVGDSIKVEDVLAMSEADRKVVLGLLGTMREDGYSAAGTTARGVASGAASGFKDMAAGISRKRGGR